MSISRMREYRLPCLLQHVCNLCFSITKLWSLKYWKLVWIHILSCLILHLWQSAYDFLDVFLGSQLTCKTMHLYKSHYHQAALCAKWGQRMVKVTRVCWTRIKYSLLVKTHRPHVVLICLFGGYIWIGVLYIV